MYCETHVWTTFENLVQGVQLVQIVHSNPVHAVQHGSRGQVLQQLAAGSFKIVGSREHFGNVAEKSVDHFCGAYTEKYNVPTAIYSNVIHGVYTVGLKTCF